MILEDFVFNYGSEEEDIAENDVPNSKPEILLYMHNKEQEDLTKINMFIQHIRDPSIRIFKKNVNIMQNHQTIIDLMKIFTEIKELRTKFIEELGDNIRPQNIKGPLGNWTLLIPKFVHNFLLYYHHYSIFCNEIYDVVNQLPDLLTVFQSFTEHTGLSMKHFLLYFIHYPHKLLKRIQEIHKCTEQTHADFKKLNDIIGQINMGLQKISAAKSDSIPKKVSDFDIALSDKYSVYGKCVTVTNNAKEPVIGLVISKISKNSREKLSQIRAEISANKELKHRNILPMVEFHEDELFWYMFWPDIGHLTLKYVMRKQKPIIEEAARPIFRQIILGIQYMHNNGFVHSSITPSVLVFYKNVLRISDFQKCVLSLKTENITTLNKLTPYSAPESLSGEVYNGSRADIWSCGIILYEMLAGKLPFSTTSTEKLKEQIKKGNITYPKTFSSSLINMLKGILHVVPWERVTVEQILSSKWMLSNQEVMISNLITVVNEPPKADNVNS